MLQSIRDGLQRHRWLMYIVLGSLALIFAAWGAYGIVNFSASGGSYAAEAGGEKIPVELARNAWVREQARYQQQLGTEIPPAQKALLQDQLLESMIREKLLTERTQKLGYRVSRQDVIEAIHSEPAFQLEGQYSNEVAKERLAQSGLTIDAFESELRAALQREQIQNGIVGSDFQTAVESQRARALASEQREVRYVLLPPDKYAGDVQVDDAAIQAYYKAHQSQYMTAESAHLQYAELRLDQLAAQVTPTDAELHATYDKFKDRYNEPEKRHARHVLIPIGKDEAAARKQAEEVLAQANAGKDFAALAKQYSQDPGSADKGGDLGWADRAQFVGPFADALFAMKVGEIRGPVKTQFGYHIIRLDEIQPGKTRPFEEVRDELAAELKRNAATDRFGEIQEQIQSRLEQSSGGDLGTLAKEFNLKTGEVPQFLRGSGGEPLGPAPPVQDLVFGESALGTGRVGGPLVVGEDRLVLVKVLEHHPPQPKPLAEVRDGIVAAIRKERGSEAALKAAQAARTKLEGGAPFDVIAKELGVSADPAKFVGRNDTTVPAQLRELVFSSPKPTDKPVIRATALQTGGAALIEVTKLRTEAPEASQAPQPEQLKQQSMEARQEAARHGEADAVAYVEELRRTADVRKNPKAFE